MEYQIVKESGKYYVEGMIQFWYRGDKKGVRKLVKLNEDGNGCLPDKDRLEHFERYPDYQPIQFKNVKEAEIFIRKTYRCLIQS